jgi:hypothetical protein
MSHSWLHVYQGQGLQTGRQVTPLKPLLEGPSGYLASAPLQKAVNVALALYRGPGFFGHKVGLLTEIQGD